jgi:two-component SAPR family response regulator
MFRAIVADDRLEVAQMIADALEATSEFIVVSVVTDESTIIHEIKEYKPQVIFLDIKMPKISGLDIAKQIQKLGISTEVIFVTSFDAYAIDAFRVNALDYLVKPVKKEEILRIAAKLKHRSLPNSTRRINGKHVFIRSLGGFDVILVENDKRVRFPTSKCEELFAYMIFHNKKLHSKWKLIELLWPDKDGDKGETNLRTTIFRLNQTFAQYSIEAKIKSENSYYMITFNNIEIDAFELEKFRMTTLLNDIKPENLVEVIKKSYPGHLFESYDYLWSRGLRTYYENFFLSTVKALLKAINKENYDLDIVVQILNYLISLWPFNDDLIKIALESIYKFQGAARMTLFYNNISEEYKKEIGTEPSREVMEVYNKLINESR